jgi:hypothetical protein
MYGPSNPDMARVGPQQLTLLASAELNNELYRLALELNFTGLVRKCAMLLGVQPQLRPVWNNHVTTLTWVSLAGTPAACARLASDGRRQCGPPRR